MLTNAANSIRPALGRVFELVAGHPALDLINTLDWRFRDVGPEELLESWEDLIAFCEQSSLILPGMTRRLLRSTSADDSARALVRVRQLREAAAAVLYAMLDGRDPDLASVSLLESGFRFAHRHRHLQWAATGMTWELPQDVVVSQLPVLLLSAGTEALLTSPQISMVRACGSPQCRWLFLDTSKNHTRRWCDMKVCGNRMKARRFKALHRQ